MPDTNHCSDPATPQTNKNKNGMRPGDVCRRCCLDIRCRELPDYSLEKDDLCTILLMEAGSNFLCVVRAAYGVAEELQNVDSDTVSWLYRPPVPVSCENTTSMHQRHACFACVDPVPWLCCSCISQTSSVFECTHALCMMAVLW